MASSFKRFDVALDLRYHSEKVWEVLTTFRYDVAYLGSGISKTVPKGYITDGGSVPQLFWSVISPWEENAGQAFVLHDSLCDDQTLEYQQDSGAIVKVPISRQRVDEILLEAMIVLDITPWKRDTIYKSVVAYRIAKGIK